MSERSISFALLVLLLAAGCTSKTPSASNTTVRSAPVPPGRCIRVSPEGDLRVALRSAGPGMSVCLEPGRYTGPFELPEGVSLYGSRDSVIVAPRGSGNVVKLSGKGSRLIGVTVDGEGCRYDSMDAAVFLGADDALVSDVVVSHAVFGILAEQVKRVTILRNTVVGQGGEALGMRGDGIRLWETTDSRVEDNVVEDSRDLVVWYSSRNHVLRNTVRRGRYGTHFMYSHQNVVEDNRYLGNEVGIFVMYSRELQLRHNLFADAQGAAGIGLGMKESGNVTASDNVFVHNTNALYLDSTPLQLDDHNVFERNAFRLSDVAVTFHSSSQRNRFAGNDFRDNQAQVHVEGGGDAMDISWEGNAFDDYRGYDLDGDGKGDVAYELRDLGDDLVSRHPNLALFQGSPTLALVSAAGELIPLFAPKTVLRDPAPLMQSPELELPNAN